MSLTTEHRTQEGSIHPELLGAIKELTQRGIIQNESGFEAIGQIAKETRRTHLNELEAKTQRVAEDQGWSADYAHSQVEAWEMMQNTEMADITRFEIRGALYEQLSFALERELQKTQTQTRRIRRKRAMPESFMYLAVGAFFSLLITASSYVDEQKGMTQLNLSPDYQTAQRLQRV